MYKKIAVQVCRGRFWAFKVKMVQNVHMMLSNKLGRYFFMLIEFWPFVLTVVAM
jgi:hypothetical protein